MDRRAFVRLLGAVPFWRVAQNRAQPRDLKVVSRYAPAAAPGMPGPFPGRVVSVASASSVDTTTGAANAETVREMMARGMRALTGAASTADAWRRFFEPADRVGIKVNCGGYPHCVSAYEIVAEVVRRLMDVGVPPTQIYLYERFQNQLDEVNYAPHLPGGVSIVAAERANRNVDNSGYDPATYLEADFFGEDDTRSNMMRLVSRTLTKIINVPNMKDHSASGVTGCLKNIAYGEFGNVARSHYRFQTETYSFIGTLAAVEPLRSRTVLNIMDGLRGVWHAGPFSTNKRYRFYPKQMKFGTDPVAIDRFLIDVIDEKRKQEGAISVWNKEPRYFGTTPQWQADPNINRFVRETGHIEYASRLGLGVYDVTKISHTEITV
jgi:Domain of unknown function (DUF362)